jgi:putative phage-type endonuclease
MEIIAPNLPVDCTANLIGVFEDSSPEWHEARAAGIGGSDVAAILGLSKWESPLSLWGKKSGRIESQIEETEAMEWGKLLEDVILEKFHVKHPELEIFAKPGTFSHRDRDWQRANPDALAYNPVSKEWFVIEIKTAAYEDEWSDKENLIPLNYRAQVLWYLQVFGFRRAFVATLFSGRKYREFTVEANDFEMELNLDSVIRWRAYLTEDKQPDYDGAEVTYETIRKLHPQIDPELPAIELGDLGIHYFNALSDFEKAEEQMREMKSRVMDAMGTAKTATIGGQIRVTRQAKGNGLPYLVNKKG